MEMITRRNKEYRRSMMDHRKIKSDFTREIVKNIPSRRPLFEGVVKKKKLDPYRIQEEVGTHYQNELYLKNQLSKQKIKF